MASSFVITPEIEQDARRLAEAIGASPTDALAAALRAQLILVPRVGPTVKASLDDLRRFAREHKLTRTHDLSEEEMLGLDENVIPEQTYLDR